MNCEPIDEINCEPNDKMNCELVDAMNSDLVDGTNCELDCLIRQLTCITSLGSSNLRSDCLPWGFTIVNTDLEI